MGHGSSIDFFLIMFLEVGVIDCEFLGWHYGNLPRTNGANLLSIINKQQFMHRNDCSSGIYQ